jgi:hypothetical protein
MEEKTIQFGEKIYMRVLQMLDTQLCNIAAQKNVIVLRLVVVRDTAVLQKIQRTVTIGMV